MAFSYEGRIATELINTLEISELKQFNHLKNSNGRTLDLALSNINNIQIYGAGALSKPDAHHPTFCVEISNTDIKFLKSIKTPKINFHKLNYGKISNEMNIIDWDGLLSPCQTDEAVEIFYTEINKLIKRNSKIIMPRDCKYPKWYSDTVIQLLNEKENYRDLYRQTGNIIYDIQYKIKRKLFKTEKQNCERKYIGNTEENITKNPKAFFAYTKSLSKTNKLPNNMAYKNKTSDDPHEIAEFFADNFRSVYDSADSSGPISNLPCNCAEHLMISQTEIENSIMSLDPNKISSPDGIPTIFYSRTIKSVVKPLLILFNKSMVSQNYPKKWKISNISPIFKSGEKSQIINYRPISIISAASKIFEKIIFGKLYSTLHHLISPKQHGFMKNKSTVTNLAELNDFIAKNLPGGGQIDIIYTDFAKAFDKVNHKILLRKLRRYNLNNCTINLIASFLSGRTQNVCINGAKSSDIHPFSSVPQGSVLSPLLFAIFINDLPECISCEKLLFADDLKLFTKIETIRDCLKLQKDLIAIKEWCTENKLSLNASKCKILTISRKSEENIISFIYKIDDTSLIRTTSIKDLGVFFDNKFSF